MLPSVSSAGTAGWAEIVITGCTSSLHEARNTAASTKMAAAAIIVFCLNLKYFIVLNVLKFIY
jgi:hypothetical protein